ncbi:LysR family transcriptional regulator [Pyxidicoccus fallax]|uniref:LysR family transcriptional regulator n=1 Tax=Pyxidicoccus fallax TaxID=394095 RepID=A0A848L597_9BACT|nr:LysR family transcriptional regulator [Pyxidicoccus fallax]NMO13869.1 LysR family transcriptional regulator [Pyxidicoccus fallax]NPC77661.1 LysR family transcriptional regulator [Pyxidicoccus fallax]
MANIPLNALNAFLAVARRRSFTAAAVELGISASALSQSVRQLEERLGVALLTRTSRSVSLTDAGRRLLENAGPAVDQAVEALKTASAQPGEVTGRVRLTVPTIAVPFIIKPLLPRLLALHPKLEVEVNVEDGFVDIVAEGFDAGIRMDESIERDMVQVRVFGPCRFVVVGSPAYLERRGTPEKPKDLLAHDCIGIRSRTTGGLYQWELEQGQQSWRLPVRGPIITNDIDLLYTMAEAGMGLAYAFEPLVEDAIRRSTLRVVLEPFAALVSGFFLYFPSRAQVSPALRAFVDVAREDAARRMSEATSRPPRRR